MRSISKRSEAKAETRVSCESNSKLFCGLCCFETEMPLSDEDVRRLEGLGYKKEDFSIVVDGVRRLRNVNGRCIFLLEDNSCKVYHRRPEGCRLYPAVLNPDTMEVEVDTTCPKSSTVKIDREVKRALVNLFRKIYPKISKNVFESEKSEELKKKF